MKNTFGLWPFFSLPVVVVNSFWDFLHYYVTQQCSFEHHSSSYRSIYSESEWTILLTWFSLIFGKFSFIGLKPNACIFKFKYNELFNLTFDSIKWECFFILTYSNRVFLTPQIAVFLICFTLIILFSSFFFFVFVPFFQILHF